jgi:cell division protein FtsW
LRPESDPQGAGYQINQSLLAIGSGGLFGVGFGHSRQKLQYLPEVVSDSIFAIVGEELGFVATGGMVLLLMLIWIRIVRIARSAADTFGRLVTLGIGTWFVVQSFLNIGAMVGLLPITGVPLPFMSHGGTALLAALAGAGLVVNISRYTRPL